MFSTVQSERLVLVFNTELSLGMNWFSLSIDNIASTNLYSNKLSSLVTEICMWYGTGSS